MSLNCFFGVELKPDGVPMTPVMPPKSSLVITQCAVTSVVPAAATEESAAGSSNNKSEAKKPYYGSVTLYVQSHELPTRFAVCTLSPTQHVVFCPLQLIFGKKATFTLVPQPIAGASSDCAYPSVHLTGYYESEQSDEDEEDDFSDEESMDDEELLEAAPVARRRGGANQGQGQSQGQAPKKGGEGKKRVRGG